MWFSVSATTIGQDLESATSNRGARTQSESRVLKKDRKSTQRERLLAGMVTAANRDGYAQANVSKIIAHAGVSRPTFYDYFADKDDCLGGALGDVHRRLLQDVRLAVARDPPEQALQASLTALLRFAGAEPAQALFLTGQAMAAGPSAMVARDQGIAAIERVIEEARSRLSATARIPDVSPRIVIGGVYRLLASRLRRGELGMSRALDDLISWVDSYERPAGERRWRTLDPSPIGPAPPELFPEQLGAPSPLPPGRPGLSMEEAAANRRQRILYAAARLAEKQGYNATTTADITRLAGVDGRAFYAAFADKQDAFMAVHELGVQQVMDATATAFFTGASWPERIWEAGKAFTGLLQSNPMFAHVGFVEAYAVGPAAVQRIEDSHVTFTIFLQEGYQQLPRRAPPSRLGLEAIITSIFEIVYREARAGRDPRLTGMLAHMAFLALAPFLGAEEANQFIDGRLAKTPINVGK